MRLDSSGRRQARTLGTRLRDVPIDALVHSPLERCLETARAVVGDRTDVALHPEDRVTECDYGRWTGRSLSELRTQDLWPVIQQTPSAVNFPDGESMLGMAARASQAVTEWVGRHPEGIVAIVSHGDVIKAILSQALGQPFDEFQRIVVGPGSLSIVRYGSDRPAVLLMNDTGRSVRVHPGAGRATVGGGTG